MTDDKAVQTEKEAAWEETAARLREQADRGYADAWIAKEPGEELFGVLVSVKAAVATQFGPVPVCELETDTGARWSLWLTHTVLRNDFLRQRPVLGERLLVRYLGRVRPESGGPPYDNYRLVVDRVDENTDVDWNGIADRYGDDRGEPAPAPRPETQPPADDDRSVPF